MNLILRDYYTAINSHAKRGGGTGNLRGDIEKYCDIIKFYDSHENKGVVMYYENLIKLDERPSELLALFNNNDISDLPNWVGYMENQRSLTAPQRIVIPNSTILLVIITQIKQNIQVLFKNA